MIALLAVTMTVHISGCSSSDSKDDTEVAQSNDETFAEEGEGDFADDSTQTADASTGSTEAPADTSLADGSSAEPKAEGDDLSLDPGADQLAQNSESTTTTTETTETAQNVGASDDLSLDDSSALPEDVASNGASAPAENITDNPATPSDAGVFEEPKSNAVAMAPEPAVSEPAPAENITETKTTETASSYAESSSKPAAVYSPYLKVKDTAFTAPGGATMNRVYLARPKDTTKTISSKIYGDATHTKDLVKWNPVLKRGVRTGDKVYYSSVTNPSDTRMMNHYEEAGLAPQSYISKDGDNIRTVSKTLLGFNDAWKEVWATNANVESKGRIPSGLEIKYWPESGASAAPTQTLAQTSPPPADMNGGMPSTLPDAAPTAPPQQAMNTQAPANDPFASAPPTQVTGANAGPDPLAPPPPSDSMAPPAAATTAATDPMAPPPPAAAAVQTPPPSAVASKTKKATVTADEEGNSDDTTMALGVGAVLLLAAAVLFVLIRKNRAKRMDLGQTQV